MKSYIIKQEERRLYYLYEGDKIEGKLYFKSWRKAEILVQNTTLYNIESKGFWSGTKYMKEKGKIVLEFKQNWKGHIVMVSNFNHAEKKYSFHSKGVFKNKYYLYDEEERVVFEVEPHFKWKSFKTEFNISVNAGHENISGIEALCLASVYWIQEKQQDDTAATSSLGML